jgi:hypothetical protein
MRRNLIIAAAAVAGLSMAGCCSSKKTVRTETASADCNIETREETQECGAYVYIPPRYETVSEQVCVQEASVQTQQIEAEYKTVCDTVVDQPGHWKDCPVPAQYKEVTETVLVSPGRKEWRKVPCASVNLNNGEQLGDAYCLVDIPPKYECRTKRVECAAACNKREWVPPTYKNVERRVMVSAARTVEIPIEPKYETRNRQQLVADGRWEWRWGVECKVDQNYADLAPRATEASPASPPFQIGSSTVINNNTSTSNPSGSFDADRP